MSAFGVVKLVDTLIKEERATEVNTVIRTVIEVLKSTTLQCIIIRNMYTCINTHTYTHSLYHSLSCRVTTVVVSDGPYPTEVRAETENS